MKPPQLSPQSLQQSTRCGGAEVRCSTGAPPGASSVHAVTALELQILGGFPVLHLEACSSSDAAFEERGGNTRVGEECPRAAAGDEALCHAVESSVSSCRAPWKRWPVLHCTVWRGGRLQMPAGSRRGASGTLEPRCCDQTAAGNERGRDAQDRTGQDRRGCG